MTHLSRQPPYWDTGIPSGRTKADIDEMLREFGAKALRWTETSDSMQFKEMPILEFLLEVEMRGVKKQIGVRIQAPLLAGPKGRGYSKIFKPNMNASMRLLYWYLKSRMEASLYGLDDVFETFMSKVMVSLPDGSSSTMGKVVEEQPQALANILPSFQIVERPMLEAKKAEVQAVEK